MMRRSPVRRSPPSLKKYVLLGALAGLVVVYIVVFMRRFMDVRVRTTSDLEEATGVGVLGVLPKTNALDQNRFLEDQADHQSEESLRQLRTNLRFVSVDQPPRSIIVTSPNPGEGKSTVTASLAHAFAKAGQPTVLIDADLRRPTIAKIFGIDNGVGLSQILSGQVGIEDAIQRFRESELYVIPAGRIPPNPSELLGSAKMRKLVEELSQEYLVLIDVPPLLPVTDGSLLSTGVDGAILVTKVGATRKDQTEGAMSMINKVKGTVLGTVMNMAPSKGIGSQYYGFGYGGYRSEYKSYYGHSAKEATSVQEKS
ncbi:polysaccharide biosynthesis tyrosine autokinase [Kocuria massiliensis]|uniref:polysaccharide biosynthesis tyrosine autokinase n=1 Tax=Kocuria massiliensis TaxID=1926282 RepID=UPI0022B9A6E6|nr:polysaccharide biosynthesis tyrosine autokinase [Kocuria massiliensis]